MWDVIAHATEDDSTLQKVIRGINKKGLTHSLPVPYRHFIDELSVTSGVLFKGSRIVIPQQLKSDMLHRIHEGHLGMEKCKNRAKVAL